MFLKQRRTPYVFKFIFLTFSFLTICFLQSHAQVKDSILIRGVILSSEDSSTLAKATIKNVRTNKSVSADDDGTFKISAIQGDMLEIFYVGRNKKTVKVGRQNNLTVYVAGNAKTQLGEVIVTGYQTLNKKTFTGSTVKIKVDDIKQDGVVDISRMLEGQAAGVSVQSVSGSFGSAPKIRIRGASSINGDNKPLWVLDGVILEDIKDVSNDQLSNGDAITLLGSAVAGINVNDIETIDILKDAAATALYGARAMNGVIVMTSKKGKVDKTTVSYTGNFSSMLRPSYNDFSILNSHEQLGVYAEMEQKGWLNYADVANASSTGIYGKMYDQVDMYNKSSGAFGVENTPAARSVYLQQFGKINTDWFKVLFRNSFAQEHSLSIATGTAKSQSYFSTSLYKDNGWAISDKVTRYTLNFRNTYKFSDKLSVEFLTTGNVRQQQAAGSEDRVPNPVSGVLSRNFSINPFSYALTTSRAIPNTDKNGNLSYIRNNYAPFNIVDELGKNTTNIDVMDAKAQVGLTYKINKNLKYDFIGSLRYTKSTTEHNVSEHSNQANAYRANYSSIVQASNPFLYKDPENPDAYPVVILPEGGFYNRADITVKNFYLRNVLSYNKKLSDISTINLFGGQEIRSTERQSSFSTGVGFQDDKGGTPFIDYRFIKQQSQASINYYGNGYTSDRYVAFFANGSYSYKTRYTIDFSAREDGSNKLGASAKNRWLPTWSVSGLWNVDDESFFKNVKNISHLSVRASYGLNANLGNANNSSIVLYNQTAIRTFTSELEPSMYIDALANGQLTWEKQYLTNFSIDMGLFNDRLNIRPELYYKKGFDLFNYVKTSGIGGMDYKYANTANLSTKGIDLTISYAVVQNKNFNWRTTATFGYGTNKITKLAQEPNIFDMIKAVGSPLLGNPSKGLYSIVYAGLDHNTGIPTFINEDGIKSTDVYQQSQQISHLKYEGSAEPKYQGGWSNNFKYKAWTLNILLTYQAGYKVRMFSNFASEYSETMAMPREMLDRWVLPGDEKLTNIPSLASRQASNTIIGYPYANYNSSNVRVADGSFIRLKTMSVAYGLPASLTKRVGMSYASLSLTANNLWLIYSDKNLRGQDPEFVNSGGVALPVTRQINLSLKVNL